MSTLRQRARWRGARLLRNVAAAWEAFGYRLYAVAAKLNRDHPENRQLHFRLGGVHRELRTVAECRTLLGDEATERLIVEQYGSGRRRS